MFGLIRRCSGYQHHVVVLDALLVFRNSAIELCLTLKALFNYRSCLVVISNNRHFRPYWSYATKPHVIAIFVASGEQYCSLTEEAARRHFVDDTPAATRYFRPGLQASAFGPGPWGPMTAVAFRWLEHFPS